MSEQLHFLHEKTLRWTAARFHEESNRLKIALEIIRNADVADVHVLALGAVLTPELNFYTKEAAYRAKVEQVKADHHAQDVKHRFIQFMLFLALIALAVVAFQVWLDHSPPETRPHDILNLRSR